MSLLLAILLGAVEGLTEFIPVSSTGHLILVTQWLGVTNDAGKSFDIVIQLGAILAVVVHYRATLRTHALGLLRREAASLRLLAALALGFVPVAVLGLLFGSAIKRFLFKPLPVAFALFAGGVLMLIVEHSRASAPPRDSDSGLESVTPRRALLIGLGQCLSLWPGSSRSMCTIVAGQLGGLSTKTAAEFSFLLALPTLGAATVYEGYKFRVELLEHVGPAAIGVGLAVSFVVAWAVIAAFLKYLQSHTLRVFGYYRIVLAAVVVWAFS